MTALAILLMMIAGLVNINGGSDGINSRLGWDPAVMEWDLGAYVNGGFVNYWPEPMDTFQPYGNGPLNMTVYLSKGATKDNCADVTIKVRKMQEGPSAMPESSTQLIVCTHG